MACGVFLLTVYRFPARPISLILRDMPIVLEDLNLRTAERTLCETALHKAGSIVEAAQLLGITRHALKRRMIKHHIEWPPAPAPRDTPVTAIPEATPPTPSSFEVRVDG